MTLTLAIVGRPNVGKSTLFNRLVGKRLALVDDRPGVTRDLREGDARLGDMRFVVVDTAGLEDATDDSLEGGEKQQEPGREMPDQLAMDREPAPAPEPPAEETPAPPAAEPAKEETTTAEAAAAPANTAATCPTATARTSSSPRMRSVRKGRECSAQQMSHRHPA